MNKKIRDIRIDKEIKQATMAKMLGISQPQYSQMENGTARITADKLKQICEILDISADYILSLPTDLAKDRLEVIRRLTNPHSKK